MACNDEIKLTPFPKTLQYDADGKMIDDRNTEVGAKLNYKDIIRENPRFEAYYRLVCSLLICV